MSIIFKSTSSDEVLEVSSCLEHVQGENKRKAILVSIQHNDDEISTTITKKEAKELASVLMSLSK